MAKNRKPYVVYADLGGDTAWLYEIDKFSEPEMAEAKAAVIRCEGRAVQVVHIPAGTIQPRVERPAEPEIPVGAYTIGELDHAISWAFDFDQDKTRIQMEDGRTSAHRAAIHSAFIFDLGGPNAAILRRAWKDLEALGVYLPRDDVFPEGE